MKGLIICFAIFLSAITSIAAEPVFVNYEEAMESENSVVIFGTDWCSNCVKLKKDLKNINFDKYVVCILDSEKEKDLSNQYQVNSYPTSVVIKKGKEVSRKIGYRKLDYQKWIDKNR